MIIEMSHVSRIFGGRYTGCCKVDDANVRCRQEEEEEGGFYPNVND